MAQPHPSVDELTIDELAHRTGLPVRTIREYHSMRLLPAPQRRGRVGVYGARHVQRLALIARLQQRGYSLAGIRDLLAAWESGADLPGLLGVEATPTALDEAPMRLTKAELYDRLPGLKPATLRRAQALGLAHPDGAQHFLVRSPALLGVVADGLQAGIPLSDLLDVVAALIGGIDALAHDVAGSIVERVWQPLAADGRAGELPGMLARGRVLLLQAVASTFADRLGAVLLARADDATSGAALRAAVERVRVGVVTDSAGTFHRRGTS